MSKREEGICSKRAYFQELIVHTCIQRTMHGYALIEDGLVQRTAKLRKSRSNLEKPKSVSLSTLISYTYT